LEFGTTLSKLQKALSDTQGQLNYEQTVAKQLQIENQYIQVRALVKWKLKLLDFTAKF